MVTACSRLMVELSLATRVFELTCKLVAIAVLDSTSDIKQIASVGKPIGTLRRLLTSGFVNSLFSINNSGVLPMG